MEVRQIYRDIDRQIQIDRYRQIDTDIDGYRQIDIYRQIEIDRYRYIDIDRQIQIQMDIGDRDIDRYKHNMQRGKYIVKKLGKFKLKKEKKLLHRNQIKRKKEKYVIYLQTDGQ